MNHSLKTLISSANVLLWVGVTSAFLGLIGVFGAEDSNALLFSYLLIGVGGVLTNVGLLAKVLAMASKAVVEGLGGNTKTDSDFNGNMLSDLTDPRGRI